MILNSLIFISYILFLFISIIGFGLVFSKFSNIINDGRKKVLFGETGIFSLLLLIPISIIINFFYNINFIISSTIFISGILFFLIFIDIKKNLKKILILIFSLLLFTPYFFIFTHHDDFFYYHLPYLNILQSFKIVFGLVNLNNVLVYPQNLWFNIFSLFRLPIIDYNGIQVLNGVFTFLFILFCYENYLNSKINRIKILSLFNIVFILTLFSRLKDHGAEIIPQLLMLMVLQLCFILLFDSNIDKKKIIIKLSFIFLIAVLLRLSSIIILPFVIFIYLINFKILKDFLKEKKFIMIVSFLIFIVFSKNIINSGCFIYPLSFTCFNQKQISWSIDKEIPKINENVILSFTRGWMIYAKENTKNSNKFIFNPKNNILTHSEYLSKGPSFWIKYWLKDADIIRIINAFLIGLFIFLVLFIENIKTINLKISRARNSKINLSLLFLFLSIMFWLFLSTPSTRYGGYAIFIAFISLLKIFLLNIIFENKIKINITFIVTIFLSLSFFYYKNISRIEFENYFAPWPKDETLIYNIDYSSIMLNDVKINTRLPTNKLKMGKLNDENNYILHCGNIKGLCTPIKKLNCIKNIEKINNYIFIYNNKKECVKLHTKHALY